MASTVTELLRRRFGGKSLPYDAEIEYLEGTGTQYIDTLLKGNLNTVFYIKFKGTMVVGTDGLFGSRGGTSDNLSVFFGNKKTQRFGSQSTTSFSFSVGTEYEVTISKSGLTVGESSVSWNQTASFQTRTNMYLFFAGGSFNKFSGKIYAAKIWSGEDLVADFIPVRVGQVGYMYDKVSKQMFGNAGTGDFILGNDV